MVERIIGPVGKRASHYVPILITEHRRMALTDTGARSCLPNGLTKDTAPRTQAPPPEASKVREVYLAQTLLEMSTIHIKQFCPGTDTARWLFNGQGKDPPHQNTVGHRWRKTLKSVQIENLKLHELRHYYASGLIAAGCDVVTVQRAMGHSSATTTLNTYAHLWPTAEDRSRGAAEATLSEALGTEKENSADSLRTAGGV